MKYLTKSHTNRVMQFGNHCWTSIQMGKPIYPPLYNFAVPLRQKRQIWTHQSVIFRRYTTTKVMPIVLVQAIFGTLAPLYNMYNITILYSFCFSYPWHAVTIRSSNRIVLAYICMPLFWWLRHCVVHCTMFHARFLPISPYSIPSQNIMNPS